MDGVWRRRLVDVREPHEYQMARIEGSILIPLSAFDPSAVPDTTVRSSSSTVQAACVAGMASQQLVESGYTGQIHRLHGGIGNLVPQRWLDRTGLTTHAAITLTPARAGYFSSNTFGRTAR